MTTKIKFCLFFIAIFSAAADCLALSSELESSNEIGLTTSYYKYKEPDVVQNGKNWANFCTIRATNIGMDYIGIVALNNNWFMRGDIIGNIGLNVQYSSDKTGIKNDKKNWYIDTRGLFGRSFIFENYALDTYFGIGYRYLYNDIRETTSNGQPGYRRESNYLYLPVGIIHKVSLTEASNFITTLEFDCLLLGKQLTHLSDMGGSYRDITNTQNTGYGGRLSFMYQLKNWSIGPYLNYWHIDDSNKVYFLSYSETEQWHMDLWSEPHNYTIEAGLRISYRF